MHDFVDHALFQKIFRALEAFRQFLADRLLDHARSGKADERVGLGDMDIAQHGVGGCDTACGRVGQNDDIGQGRIAQHFHGDRGARHLHQRQAAFLHARATGSGENDQRCLALHRLFGGLDEALAGGHAERAAHEGEILNQDDAFHPADMADGNRHRVIAAGLLAGGLDARGVGLVVLELQRVLGNLRCVQVLVLTVEGELETPGRSNAHVMPGGRHEQAGFQVLVKDHFARLGALDPKIVGRVPLGEDFRHPRRCDLGQPVLARVPFIHDVQTLNGVQRAQRMTGALPILAPRQHHLNAWRRQWQSRQRRRRHDGQ